MFLCLLDSHTKKQRGDKKGDVCSWWSPFIQPSSSSNECSLLPFVPLLLPHRLHQPDNPQPPQVMHLMLSWMSANTMPASGLTAISLISSVTNLPMQHAADAIGFLSGHKSYLSAQATGICVTESLFHCFVLQRREKRSSGSTSQRVRRLKEERLA